MIGGASIELGREHARKPCCPKLASSFSFLFSASPGHAHGILCPIMLTRQFFVRGPAPYKGPVSPFA